MTNPIEIIVYKYAWEQKYSCCRLKVKKDSGHHDEHTILADLYSSDPCLNLGFHTNEISYVVLTVTPDNLNYVLEKFTDSEET
jgi:hypothetical protein